MIALIVAVGRLAAPTIAAPTTTEASPTEDAKLRRAAEIRKVLVDTLEKACAADGVWPQRLELPPGSPPLVYTAPRAKEADARLAGAMAEAIIVLQEPIERNPQGVWVGYADGHLEFAVDAEALASCKDQLRIIRETIAARGSLFDQPAGHLQPASSQPVAPPKRTIDLVVLDSDGHPVEGALVGMYGQFGDVYAGEVQHAFYTSDDGKDLTMTTGPGGRVSVPASWWTRYVLDERRGLVALEIGRLTPDADKPHEVRLAPACRVAGRFISVELPDAGRNASKWHVMAFPPGQVGRRAVFSDSKSPQFELLLPPGDYTIEFDGTNAYYAGRYVHIEPGHRDMNFEFDLVPATLATLVGRPAPELTKIKGWKNGEPTKLADLRGKVVLLDFWGYWCGPCVGAMPELMRLHDKFKDKGLTVVAVHDDSVESIAEMDEKLQQVKKEVWGGRDLPFLVALDGGGETRVRGTIRRVAGATVAAYGLDTFPTTLLIGRDGNIIQHLRLFDREKYDEIERTIEKTLSTP